jgi:hypothetical protein
MFVKLKKITATSLILGLVFPYLAEAQLSTSFSLDIDSNNATRSIPPSATINAADVASPTTNFDSIAPTETIRTFNSITTTLPNINADGTKEEGTWNFTVTRFGLTDSAIIQHDLTPTTCPPVPTPQQYANETDYYTVNNLLNPWPVGLNGQWASDPIEINQSGPLLCRDQITLQGKTYVERNYTLGQCVEPDGTPKLHYKEDLDDCLLNLADTDLSGKTAPRQQMSGCYSDPNNLSIAAHNTAIAMHLLDNANNARPAATICRTPISMLDTEAPELTNFEIEHQGLSLPQETLQEVQANANRFRADDGALIMHAEIKDVDATTGSGKSGVNWEPITTDPNIAPLRNDIATAESLLMDQYSALIEAEARIILKRVDILTKLSSVQRNIIINNLIHKISGEINNTSNFFMQALIGLIPNLQGLQNNALQTNKLASINTQINRSKFDDVAQIEQHRTTVDALSFSITNQGIANYVNALPLLINRSNISQVGDDISLIATTNAFNSYYNQWQIDKRKNYASFLPSWSQDLINRDQQVEGINEEFQKIKTAYESDDTLILLQKLTEVVPSSNLFSLIQATETTATDHRDEQVDAISRLVNMDTVLDQTLSYLQGFDPNTDSFQNQRINQLNLNLNPAQDAIIGLNGDLQDFGTPGSFANSLRGLGNIEDTNEIQQLMNFEQAKIRALNTEILGLGAEINADIEAKDVIIDTIGLQERTIALMKENLVNLVSANTTLSTDPTLTFEQQKITHLVIERLTSPPMIEDFFPPSTIPVNGDNYEWDLNSFRFSGESAPIFSQAGTYRVRLRVFDQAANETFKNGYIQILPDTLVVDVTGDCNVAASIPVADNNDSCRIQMPQFDKFGNNIQNRALKLSVRDQNINGSYNMITQQGTNYQNGLRFAGGTAEGNQHVISWNPGNADTKTIRLRSLLPTLTVLPYEPDPSYGVGFANNEDAEVPLLLEHPNIGPRGEPDTTQPLIQSNVELPIKFKPWVETKVKGNAGSFTNGSWFPKVQSPFNVYVEARSSAVKLPTDFRINVTGFIGNSYEFNDVDVADSVDFDFRDIDGYFVESDGLNDNPSALTTTINSVSALSGQQSPASMFIPITSYPIGSRTITVPGLPAGTCPGTTPDCFDTPPPEDPPDITISNAATNEEGPGVLNFEIGLTKLWPEDVRIYFETTDIEAEQGPDYIFDVGRFATIKANTLSTTYPINVVDDLEPEETERMTLSVNTFEPADAVNDDTAVGTGTIYDGDNSLKIESGRVVEGIACLMPIKLHGPAAEDITIQLNLGIDGDTATAGDDYIDATVTDTIPAGETFKLVAIPTVDDNEKENEESFTVTIGPITGGDLTQVEKVSTCVIEDNEREPNVYLSNVSVTEGQVAQIEITLGEGNLSGYPDNEPVELELSTFALDSPDKATPGMDYVSKTFTVPIPAGMKKVVAPLDGITTNNDDEIEENERFGIRVSDVITGTVGNTSRTAKVTIKDATVLDPTLDLNIASISTEYGTENTPTENLQFDVVLDNPNTTGSDITIVLETKDIEAEGGPSNDYTNNDLTVVIPDGSLSGKSTVATAVTINDDNEIEGRETFRVQVKSITPASAITSASATGLGIISDNDAAAPDIRIDDASGCESAGCENISDGSIIFKVSLSRPHNDENGDPLIVTYSPSPMSADEDDYVAGVYTARFNDGDQVSFLEPITLKSNSTYEGSEEFLVSFGGIESGHTLNDTSDTAVGTILDRRDIPPVDEPSITISDASGTEGETVTIEVELTEPAQGDTIVTLQTNNLTASSNDYDCTGELALTFLNGETGPIDVNCELTPDNRNSESTEQFSLSVNSYSGIIATGGDSDQGIISILNRTGPPTSPSIRIGNASGNEGQNILIPVTLTSAALNNTTINLGAVNISTTNSDYSCSQLSVTFNTGEEGPKMARCSLTPDAIDESNEKFKLRVESYTGTIQAGGNADEGEITILEATVPGTNPSINIGNATGQEGESVTVEVRLTQAAKGATFVTLETTNDTASNNDYSCDGEMNLTFENGEQGPIDITCVLTADNLDSESTERFNIAVNSYSGNIAAGGDTNEGTVSILNRITPTSQPSILVGNASGDEGDTVSIPVRLTAPAINTTTVVLATENDSTTNSDYSCSLSQRTVTFNTGEEGPKMAECVLNADGLDEDDEKFKLSVNSYTGAVDANGDTDKGEVTILGSTPPEQDPNIIISGDSATEGGRAMFTVALDAPARGRLEIELAPQPDSATADDYTCSADMTVIFANGEMRPQSITCDIENDGINEPTETFDIAVIDTDGNVNDTSDTGTITIYNFQTLDVVLEAPAEPVMENDKKEGETLGYVEFMLTLYDNGAPIAPGTTLERLMDITVTPEDILAIGGINLTAKGIDYQQGPINVNLIPGVGNGSTVQRVAVAINDDNIREINTGVLTHPENRQENFNMALSSLNTNVRTLTDAEGVIEDDDMIPACGPAVLKMRNTSVQEGEEVYFDVSLDRTNCDTDLTLNFRTVNAGAEAGSDFNGGNLSVTIPAGAREPNPANHIFIQTLNDTETEGNEDFNIEFVDSVPADAIIRADSFSLRNNGTYRNRGTAPAIITIYDEPDGPEIPDMTIDDISATEGANLNFPVSLSNTTNEDTRIEFTATRFGGSPTAADPDIDFTVNGTRPVIATASILAGQTNGIALIRAIDDTEIEVDQEFIMNYSGLPSGFLDNTSDTAIGTIVDNDIDVTNAYPSVTVSNASAVEGQPMTFSIGLEYANGNNAVSPTGGLVFDVLVGVDSGSDAANANEFQSGVRSVNFPENVSNATFTVTTNDDLDPEPSETFIVEIQDINMPGFLDSVSEASLATSGVRGVGTINDDDIVVETCEILGTCPQPLEELPGAAIEGQIIADRIVCLEEDGSVSNDCANTEDDSIVLGVSTVATDIREEITRNAYQAIRGKQPANAVGATIPLNTAGKPIIVENGFTQSNGNFVPRWDIYVDDLPEGGVTYLNGDFDGTEGLSGDEFRSYFRIGLRENLDGTRTPNLAGDQDTNAPAVMSGNHTFIVMNASLNIIGDIEYSSPNDSLGIIVMNDNLVNAGNLSRRGQLTVYRDVKHIVGALFTDGSLVSNVWIDAGAGGGRRVDGGGIVRPSGPNAGTFDTDPANDWDVTNGFNADGDQLGRQLILSGNILSKNTIGKADLLVPESPWGEDLVGLDGKLIAQMYDFNYIRRYVPVYTTPGVLDTKSRNLCATVPGETECYQNKKSFVIRVDPRLRENPPPAFQASGVNSLR